MSTPYVTGAAAVLRQMHPEWTVDELRSALIGSAHDLGRAAYEQGAGRLDVLAASRATLFVTPATLAFGRVPPGSGDFAEAETLHVRSLAPGPVTVSLALLPRTRPAGLDMTLEPAELQLADGAEGIALLTLHV